MGEELWFVFFFFPLSSSVLPLSYNHLMGTCETTTANDVDNEHGADGCGCDDHEHDNDLIFDGGEGVGPCENLAGHHAG